MNKYVDGLLSQFPKKWVKLVALTPASAVLFKVCKATAKLDTMQAQCCHTFVENLLYLDKRFRHDIATSLTTRVSQPDRDD